MKKSNEDIITIGGSIALAIIVYVVIRMYWDKLAELKNNTPIIFWLVIVGTIIAIPLLIFGIRYLYSYIQDKS